MAEIITKPSRTFSEYLLLPNLTDRDCTVDKVSLKIPLARYKTGETPPLELNIPFTSAIMQAVSNQSLAIALARRGGLSFIYQSQSISSQAEMVRKVKNFKAGFVVSDSNLKPDHTLLEVKELAKRTDHTTMAVTEDGTANGRLLGIITGRDYSLKESDLSTKVSELMTPFEELVYAEEGVTLREANDLIWRHKLNSLPIVDGGQQLAYLVFRKDYDEHMENPDELIDDEKRLRVGAGINTRDYRDRVPALVEAGVDVLCIDSSDGFSEWQGDTIEWIKKIYGDRLRVGAGNVVDREGFLYLSEAGADFIKVGIGGGSICITREQKGIGRGQATAVIEVSRARNEYYGKTGEYIPICSDGGIVLDYHIVLALAMGADFVMMGRYFSRFDESPGKKLRISGNYVKEYWAEGSERARNWQRYDVGTEELSFEEGVDIYIPYAGKLKDNVDITIAKLKATMVNCGAFTVGDLQKKARLTVVSATTLRESGTHDVIAKENELMPPV
jgi:IMP dehydrogenase